MKVYLQYAAWLKELNNKDLNLELNKVTAARNAAQTQKTRDAWTAMVTQCKNEMSRRDAQL